MFTFIIELTNKADKESSRKKELKSIKKKFGLESVGYSDKMVVDEAYSDRAENRRKEIGSDNPYEKTDVASDDMYVNIYS